VDARDARWRYGGVSVTQKKGALQQMADDPGNAPNGGEKFAHCSNKGHFTSLTIGHQAFVG
jgi:hypothetical protein